MELAAQHEAGAEPGADREEDEVLDPASDALPLLADGGEVDVVVDDDGDARAAPRPRRRSAIPSRPAKLREADDARRELDDAGHADDGAVDQLRGQPVASTSESRSASIASSTAAASAPIELDVLARPHLAVEVADRPAQEARAEVEAEHERRFRDRLEEDRAVARPSGIVGGLAHEAGVEERLQRQRDGRLRDPDPPRDLGPRDRRPGADRLQHGALVEVLQQRRRGAGSARSWHLVRNPNQKRRKTARLDFVVRMA